MEKIVYVYGSARNSATRAARRAALPREMQVRLGPWIIRPARRTPVDTDQLAKYEREVIEKVTNGLIQVQNGATVPYSIEAIRSGFAALRAEPGAATPMTMPYAELMELMRSESPSQEVWDAFVARSLNPSDADREMLPGVELRLRALTEYAEKNSAKLNTIKSLKLINETRERLAAEKTAAREAERIEREKAEAEAEAERLRRAETDVPPPGPVVEAQMGDAPPTITADDPEQMDFSEPAADAAAPEVSTPAVETAPATPVATGRAEREARLPEGWKTFTNAKLVELLTGLEIAIPERQNKASLSAAVEAWLEGS